MTRKVRILIVLTILLAGLSLYLNKDWFARDHIQISSRSRPIKGRSVTPVIFFFNHPLRLKLVRVAPLDDLKGSIWHLVSASNSIPIKEFSYGGAIWGMRPSPGVRLRQLQAGEKYRLFVEAVSFKGQYDFTAQAGLQQPEP